MSSPDSVETGNDTLTLSAGLGFPVTPERLTCPPVYSAKAELDVMSTGLPESRQGSWRTLK
eukprot:1140341-Rhodomonas_salina.1